jgi:murein DD-endopeptidase MepM/ murein hydrolase activator NlpD
MKLKLLKILTEEVEEQGYGRYYTDVVLPSGVKVGDTRGYNFLSGNSINKSDKVITKVLSNSSTVTYNNSGLVTLSPYKTIYPLSKKGTKSSGYGWRNHPIKKKRKHHNGIDLAVPDGTGVNSVADGEVVRADMKDYEGYGNFIIIKHDLDGETFYSAYAHLTKMLVSVDNKVKQGQKIALSGGGQGLKKGGGLSTGSHLHFEIRKTKTGDWVDPEPYLSGAGIVDGSVDDTKDKEDEEEIKKDKNPIDTKLPANVQKLMDKLKDDYGVIITQSHIDKEYEMEGDVRSDAGGVNEVALTQITKLISDCKKANPTVNFPNTIKHGVSGLVSGYRSYDYQVRNFGTKVRDKGRTIENVQASNCLPGFTQHHTGKAFDIFSTETDWWDKNPKVKKWVVDNCKKYGFKVTYTKPNQLRIPEPWHLFYIG